MSTSMHIGLGSEESMPGETDTSEKHVYIGKALRAVAMPLGGLGTGSVALCGDGGLRQWQVFNNVNHIAHVPHSFFGVWVRPPGKDPTARVLMSNSLYDDQDFVPSASVSDHVVPEASRRLLATLPGVQGLEFVGQYPVARLTYHDDTLPIEVSLEAFSPLLPLETEDSGLPAVIFNFELRNPGSEQVAVSLLATLQNAVGWDGISAIDGIWNPGYGGNQNSVQCLPDWTALLLKNTNLPVDHPHNGTLVLAALTRHVLAKPCWHDPSSLWAEFSSEGRLTDIGVHRPSDPGRTWNGALTAPVILGARDSRTITFLLCWHFPNRLVDWNQATYFPSATTDSAYIGTYYARRFGSALAVAEYVCEHLARLSSTTLRFRDMFFASTLAPSLLDAVSSQLSTPRSPTCFWAEDGRFYGFEGCRGASTPESQTGGCCPLNCTHVWNYALSLSRLYPDLERTMREIDLLVQMGPDGEIPHRTLLPVEAPRPWRQRLRGPENPAVDGELGAVLKVYREVRQGAGLEWLTRLWPAVKRLMAHLMDDHDADGDGIIKGEQPNTYDISFYGPNSIIGSLYLAALRAAEKMAQLQGEPDTADRFRARFEVASERLDAILWNGEYYAQQVDLEEHPKYQYGQGCHADQLFGQWWAQVLDLGYLLPREHVRSALKSIMRFNWRRTFQDVRQQPRVFADASNAGLINCAWPHGGRPAVPALYSDEVWTGIEYEVGALLLWEGMTEEALKVIEGVRARYDGTRRSPWNEIECGDHYVRAMSSWALLEAAAGCRYDAVSCTLGFAPTLHPENHRSLFVAGNGWGVFAQRVDKNLQVENLLLEGGSVDLTALTFQLCASSALHSVEVTLDGTPLLAEWRDTGKEIELTFRRRLSLVAEKALKAELVFQ